jgi:hypothetical protein
MVNLKLLPALASYMAMADDALQVNISIDKAEVPRGDSVTYTCTWNLDAEYDPCQEESYLNDHGGNMEDCKAAWEMTLHQFELSNQADPDYEIEDFQLFWKLNDEGARQSVARYQPGETPEDERKIFYHNTQVTDRIDLTAEFSEQSASLTITDLNLQDDDMLISCEVHWASRFGIDETSVNVYVDASAVELDAIETSLEGREREDVNGTVFAVEEADVAHCNIFNVYPEPSSVTFTVGDDVVEVAATAEQADEEGLFNIAAVLTLMPSADIDQKEVSCYSQASSMAPQMPPTSQNATFALDVTYYTTEVTLEISGANENGEGYYINENEEYEVLCRANGNPAPTVTILGTDSVEIPTGSQAIAVRDDSIQYITCTAHNNEDDSDFAAGEPVQASKELDVYYLDEPITDIAEQYTYGEEVTIICKAEGNPEPQFSWTKDDQSLAGGSSHTFSGIQYSDAGSYTCTASNAAKELTSTDDITVDGECLVHIVEKEATASQTPNAAALMLSCEVQGPDCAITWSSADEPELVAQGNSISEEGEGLTVTNKLFFEAIDKRTNPVNFICSGQNHHGEVTDTVQIDENDDPVCCANVDAGNLGTAEASLGTGAIVGIVIAIPAILIIVGAVVFFCRNKHSSSDDDCKSDLEEGNDEEPGEKAPLTSEGDGDREQPTNESV